MKFFKFFFFLYCMFPVVAIAQDLRGRVLDDRTLQPLSWANVVLVQAGDSSFVEGTVTDDEGHFSLSPETNGHFLLKISTIGYKSRMLDLNADRIDTVRLSVDEQRLGEVVVTASKPYMEMNREGLTVNVQDSHLKEVGVLSDVLEQIPLVTKDKDNFEVFGKGTPLIYINNRKVRNLSELENLNSNGIKKITVITTPGPKYDASVKSVIRIETIRQTGDGLGGSLYAYAKQNKKFTYNLIGDLNYRIGKLDFFGSFGYYRGKRKYDIKMDRAIDNTPDKFTFAEPMTRLLDTKTLTGNGGFNYVVDDSNSFGMRYEYNKTPSDRNHILSSLNAYRNNKEIDVRYSDQQTTAEAHTHYLNAYYDGKIAPWLSVKLDMDWAEGQQNNNQDVSDRVGESVEKVVTRSDQNYDLFAVKLTFDTPLGKKYNLVYGGEYSYTNNQQVYVVEQSLTPILKPDNNISKQNLFAAFVNTSASWEAFTFDAGLRFENVSFDYYVNGVKKDEQSRTYAHLFPSVGLSYSRSGFNSSVSYTRSISRPNYYQLRNSMQYHNPYWYEDGNPFLQPSVDNTLSGMFGWKDFLFSINLDIYKEAIFLMSKAYEKEIIVSRMENVSNYKNLTASLVYSKKIGIWKPSLTLSVYKDFFRYGEPERSYGKPVYGIDLKNSWVFPKDFQLRANLSYLTSGHSETDYVYENFKMNIYLSKKVAKDRLRLNLGITDLFGTSRFKTSTRVDNLYKYLYNDMDPRGVYLSVTYNFNPAKNKYKGEKASEERRRLY